MRSRRAGPDSLDVTPEEPDDLLALRRVIERGDAVSGSTTRAIRQERERIRPDRGERVRISVTVLVERASLDAVLDRLRISGTIERSSHEAVAHGSHHSLIVSPGERVTITKRRWTRLQRSLLRASSSESCVLVAIDPRECGVARLTGTRLHVLPGIRSGAAGKRFASNDDTPRYFASVRTALLSLLERGDALVVFGPGRTKNRLCAALAPYERIPEPRIAEGIDSGGEDGIHTFAKSDAMRKALSESKLARVLGIIDEAMRLARMQSGRFAMGRRDVSRAVAARAAESVVFSDALLASAGEDEAVALLNDAEAGGAAVYAADSTTDIGKRVSGMGGVIALLRYAL